MPLRRARMRCERVLLSEYTYTTPPPNSIFFSVFKYSCNQYSIVLINMVFVGFCAVFGMEM